MATRGCQQSTVTMATRGCQQSTVTMATWGCQQSTVTMATKQWDVYIHASQYSTATQIAQLRITNEMPTKHILISILSMEHDMNHVVTINSIIQCC